MLDNVIEKARAAPPLLRWAGSKKKALPAISKVMPPHGYRYIEAFAGSACLFFHAAPNEAILSDNNIDLVRFYDLISQHAEEVYAIFVSIPRDKETYYKIREALTEEPDPIRWAAHFFYLNRNCFNGIYRTNLQGKFNVPFSNSRVSRYPTKEEVLAAAAKLAKASIVCIDFEELCSNHVRSGDLVYLDPPYYVPQKRIFREYSSKPFNEEDFARLERTLCLIDQRDAKFIMSYPDCDIVKDMAGKWKSSYVSVNRSVASNPKARGRARELILRNF